MIEIKMPQLGQTTDEVRIVRWLVKEGQEVKRGEPLCEVETDKTTMELESYESGTVLKINVEPDTIVNSGAVIALIGKAGEIKESKKAEKKDEAGHGKIEITETALTESRQESGQERQDKLEKAAIEEGIPQREYGSEVKVTSLVKNLAKMQNIDLHLVKGTGPQGLITRDDLDNFIKGKTGGAASAACAKEIILTQSQSAVARSLSKSKSEIPHYYLKTEIFADNILKWREKNRNAANEKVSMYSIIVYAVANVLMQMPKMNAYFKENRIILYEDFNIGFAVGVEDELFVPVIKNANKKDIMQIDLELKKLVAKTSSKKFESGDLADGTFTISNLGMYDIDEFCAIINPQQSGILAVGKLKKVLHIDESDRMIIRNAFIITGSFDHRFVNGKTGAEFLSKLKHFMENENE